MSNNIKAQAAAKLLEAYGPKLKLGKVMAGGSEQASFMVSNGAKKYVLRVSPPGRKSPEELETEASFMTFLRAAGMPAPQVESDQRGRLFTRVKLGRGDFHGLLMELMHGIHPEPEGDGYLQLLASTQARMHVLGQRFAADRGKRGFILPYGLCHYDVAADNIMVRNGELSGILDFGDIAYAPLANCIALAFGRLPRKLRTRKSLQIYLAEYGKIRPVRGMERLYLEVKIFVNQPVRRVLGLSV